MCEEFVTKGQKDKYKDSDCGNLTAPTDGYVIYSRWITFQSVATLK